MPPITRTSPTGRKQLLMGASKGIAKATGLEKDEATQNLLDRQLLSDTYDSMLANPQEKAGANLYVEANAPKLGVTEKQVESFLSRKTPTPTPSPEAAATAPTEEPLTTQGLADGFSDTPTKEPSAFDILQQEKAAGNPVGTGGPTGRRSLESTAGRAERYARRYIKKYGAAGRQAASGLLQQAANERMGQPSNKSQMDVEAQEATNKAADQLAQRLLERMGTPDQKEAEEEKKKTLGGTPLKGSQRPAGAQPL